MKNKTLRIGSRGSELALWQAHWVRERLAGEFSDLEISITVIRTTGDRIADSPLPSIGDKGLFTKEIERALLDRSIDLAVHSLKDLPTLLPDDLMIGAVTRREDVRDVFIPHPANRSRRLADQENGARIATGSLRRRAQLLNAFPHLKVVDLRGNVPTRFRKLEESEWSGMILASAGVKRLGLDGRIGEFIATETMLPAVGQGALAIEIRSGDDRTSALVEFLNDPQTEAATRAERSLLRKLEGGCQVPVGAYGRVGEDSILRLNAVVATLDGTRVVKGEHHGKPGHADRLGTELAGVLLDRGAGAILQTIRPAAGGD